MKHLIAILFIVFTIPVFGQYQYFTNINQNQVYDNASFTGNSCGPRLLTSIKSYQKTSATGAHGLYLSYDMPFQLSNGDYIGIGGRLTTIKESFTNTKTGNLTASYNRLLSAKNSIKHLLSFGAGFSVAQRNVGSFSNSAGIIWPSQIDSSGFNPNLPGDPINFDFIFPEVEVGLSYSVLKNENEYLRLGVSIKDINKANISFLGENDQRLPTALIMTGQSSIKALENIFWQPEFKFFKVGERNSLNFSSNFKYLIPNRAIGIIAGVGYTNNKLLNINLGLDFNRISGIFSYAFNLGSESANVAFPNLELGLGYRFCD